MQREYPQHYKIGLEFHPSSQVGFLVDKIDGTPVQK